jgi:superfamily I DNA and/or RNA helicase
MSHNFEDKSIYLTLRKPIFQNFNEIKNLSMNSIEEEESIEEKKTEKEIKLNDFNTLYLKQNFFLKPSLGLSSKINIIISNDDILQEQKLLNSNKLLIVSENSQNKRKLIFTCNKRLHDEEYKFPDNLDSTLATSIKNG